MARTVALETVVAANRIRRAEPASGIRHGYFHSLEAKDGPGLRTLIGELRDRFGLVSYSQACSGDVETGFAWSVDDGFASSLRAAELFAAEGVSACFFLSPHLLSGFHASTIEYFRFDYNIEADVLDWSGAERLLELGHEVGSHTINHFDMATLSEQQLVDELGGSRAELETRLGPIKHFAWPFGQWHQFSEPAYSLAKQIGYETVASAERPQPRSYGDWRDGCIERDHLDPSWPVRHSMYFATRSVGG